MMQPLLIGGRLDRLRAALTTTHTAQWRRLHEQCAWYRGQSPPAEHPLASITWLGPAAMNLALAYRLTGQPGYLTEARRWIGAAVSYPHWGRAKMPDHDLDAGWLLHGLSLAYSWLRDDLPAGEADALGAKLRLQGGRMYDFAVRTEGSWWSSSYWQNHNWICYAGLAAAGYALDVPAWSDRARDNLGTVLDLLPADGSDAEGVVYWRYGVPWLAIHLDLLQHAEGVDWWERGGFLRHTFAWRLHQCAPGFEENVDHGDCHDRRSGHSVALYHKLAAVYRDGHAAWLADRVARQHFWREAYASGVRPGVMPEAGYELLWYDPRVAPVDPAGTAATTAYFPDLGQVTARTGWHDTAAFVSFKSAPGGGHTAWETSHRLRRESGWETLNAGHHHPDAGSFVFGSHGEFLAVDDGYCNGKRAAHHNLVLVDGQGWAGEDRYHVYQDLPYERQARLRDVLATGGLVHATSESAAMFDPALGVRRVDRTLVFTPSGRLVLLDELAADQPREWTFLLHSDWPAEVVDGDLALRSGPAQAWVRRLAPADAPVETTTTTIEANPTASTPSLRIVRELRTVRVRVGPSGRQRLLTAIESTSALAPEPATAETVPCVAGAGVRFGTGETVLLSPGERRIDGGGVDADAAAVILLPGADGQPGRLGLVAATRVEVAGRTLLDGAEPVSGVLPWPA
ncbi:heparinase II/III family protein [Micromonospora sp. WMMD1076]|uniref:heparinase II/III family protein n=1 Tax=Micromonospora sp. WMMD1076 TaxID=3016103 RepID=UPI00249A28B0|nr:heparinase II/III family protein [Micromonospora sp. WMMD1076]WFF04496.1 heparinase II/III family protein [Micromonospora sp. WMMD1076]